MTAGTGADADRLARATWSRIAEPGDSVATRLIRELGPLGALEALRAGHAASARFAPRLEGHSPKRDVHIAARAGARIVVPGDDEWPVQLDLLEAPPVCLWVRGPRPLPGADVPAVAVVGARAATPYGEQIAGELGHDLAADGTAVVSGAAFGIDAAAHRGALSAGGWTVAVLAGGVDRAYPAAHERLVDEIGATGTVVSEVAPASAPTRARFLQRNRLIAALGRGTVVVEAGLRSGSLSTARHALRQGLPVGAVPGPVTSAASAGCHELVRSGAAVLVTDAAEVRELTGPIGALLPVKQGPAAPHDGLDLEELRVWDALSAARGADVARVARGAGVGEAEALSVLGRLSLTGLARQERDGLWYRGPGQRG